VLNNVPRHLGVRWIVGTVQGKLELASRWRWSVDFMPQPLIQGGRSPNTL